MRKWLIRQRPSRPSGLVLTSQAPQTPWIWDWRPLLRGAASPLPSRFDYFLLAKIVVPLVWVAIAVWSQEDVLLVLASQPELFGPFGSNWSSL